MHAYLKKVYLRKISLPFRLPRVFGKSLHFLKTLKDETTTPVKKLYELYVVAYGALFVILFKKFKVNIRYQPRMLISISGVDGSGKTTYAKILYDILSFCELRTSFVWSRVGSSNFLKPLSKMVKIFYNLKKRKNISEYSENSEEESEARRKDLFGKSLILRELGLFILLLEMLWQYTFKIRLPLFLNKVVICDRYIYDTIVDIVTRYKVNPDAVDGKLFTKILTALTPKPDLAYVLTVPLSDVCNRRKVGSDVRSLIKEQIDLYKEISLMYNLRQISTNNGESINEISDKINHQILMRYYEKWESNKS